MNKYGGRKFLIVILAALLFIVNDAFGWGLEEATIENIITVIAMFVGVEGIADAISRFKKKK